MLRAMCSDLIMLTALLNSPCCLFTALSRWQIKGHDEDKAGKRLHSRKKNQMLLPLPLSVVLSTVLFKLAPLMALPHRLLVQSLALRGQPHF